VNESAKKKKYSRDGESAIPWPVASLSVTRKDDDPDYQQRMKDAKARGEKVPKSWEKSFYSASEFSVKNYIFSKAITLKFPDYLLMSNNYYEKKWGMTTHRRLKNVIVTMDFCPSKKALREIAAVGKGFSKEQEATLKRAFLGADSDGTGSISVTELKEVLRAVDVDVDGADGDKFFDTIPDLTNRVITFDELKHYLTQRQFYRVQAGRYFVALSLFEAECMRAVIHQQSSLPLIPGKDTIVALRTERTLLDNTYGYEPAQSHQDQTAKACYRFIDSQANYQPRELTLLLRALQNNELERRYNYFVEVRSNRRRKQIPPETTALSKIFITADEHHLLNYKIAAGRITALLKKRGMYPRDLFAAIDRDRDGLLSADDIRRGMEWLESKLDPVLIAGFMTELDKDQDGYINLDEFKMAVGFEEDADFKNTVAFNGGLSLPPMPSENEEKRLVKIPEPVLASIKVKIRKVTKFSKVWNSQGSMSRDKISIWKPDIASGGFKQNKASVCLGHFCGKGYDNPNRDSTDRLCLEVTDTSGGWVGGSSWLPHVLDRFLPHPARFRLAWSLTHGANQFYGWEPVPPGEGFVALGFVGTKTNKQPPVKSMRCVPVSWCKESTYLQKVWDDSGASGRAGSVWLINTLNLVGFVSGSDPPLRQNYDLKSRRFFLKEFSDTTSNQVAAVPGNYTPPTTK
jgi:Ca2+-binding EF-hand superfamily protein